MGRYRIGRVAWDYANELSNVMLTLVDSVVCKEIPQFLVACSIFYWKLDHLGIKWEEVWLFLCTTCNIRNL